MLKECVCGLANLVVEVSRLSLIDIRALYQSKYDVVNPVSRSLDLEHRAGERERSGSFYTTCEDVERTLYDYLICSELFQMSIKDHCGDSKGKKPLSPEMRRHWMSCCMPDGCYPYHQNLTEGEYKLLDLHQLINKNNVIKALNILLPSPPNSLSRLRDAMLARIMGHHGLDTLRILRAGSVAPAKDLYAHIREEAEQRLNMMRVTILRIQSPLSGMICRMICLLSLGTIDNRKGEHL